MFKGPHSTRATEQQSKVLAYRIEMYYKTLTFTAVGRWIQLV